MIRVAVSVAVAVGPICPQEGVSNGALIVRLAVRGFERTRMCGRCRGCGAVVGEGRHGSVDSQGNGGDVRSAWAASNPR